MRSILIFAAFVLAIAVFAPRFLPRPDAVATADATASQRQPQQQAAGARSFSIARGQNGHFQTEAMVDGRRIGVLVDTGASVIALREADAARLGIHPSQREYTMKVNTANGVVLAAPIEFNRVEIGDLTVRNVAGLVLPDEALAQNLLGMSFLSRVHWQYEGSRLVLEQ
jgi:aspartyl protease family protein